PVAACRRAARGDDVLSRRRRARPRSRFAPRRARRLLVVAHRTILARALLQPRGATPPAGGSRRRRPGDRIRPRRHTTAPRARPALCPLLPRCRARGQRGGPLADIPIHAERAPSVTAKTNLLDLAPERAEETLREFAAAHGLPAYRGSQIARRLWRAPAPA